MNQRNNSKSRRRYTVLLVGLLILMFVVQLKPVTQAQDNSFNWLPAVQISPKYSSDLLNIAQFPAITTDNDGNAHVFWASQRRVRESAFGGYDTVVYCAIRNNFCRESTEILAYNWRQSQISPHPSVVIDVQNTLHIVTRGITGQSSVPRLLYQQVPIEQVAQIDILSSARPLSGRQRVSYSDIIIDEKDTLHVAWSEAVPPAKVEGLLALTDDGKPHPCPLCADVFYRQSPSYGRAWSEIQNVSDTLTGSEKPVLLAPQLNQLVLMWEEGVDYEIGSAAAVPVGVFSQLSPDDGRTWGKQAQFNWAYGELQRFSATIDSQGRIMVVWGVAGQPELFSQISTDEGVSWSRPEPIPSFTYRTSLTILDDETDNLDLAVDSLDRFHLIAVGKETSEADVVTHQVTHFVWDDGWSTPNIVHTTGPLVLPEAPKLAMGKGNNLHATWFVRQTVTVGDVNEPRDAVWYANLSLRAPSQPRLYREIFIPTATPVPPTPIPTVTPVLPTATPTLALEHAQAPVDMDSLGIIFTDMDEIIIFLRALAPSAGIFLAVIIYQWYRKRILQ